MIDSTRPVLGAPHAHVDPVVRHPGLDQRAVRRVVLPAHVERAREDRRLAALRVPREPLAVRLVRRCPRSPRGTRRCSVVVDTWLRPPPQASVCSPLTIAPASTNPCAASIGPSASVRLNVSPGLISVPLILLAPLVMFTVRRGSLVSGVSNSETISLTPSASSAAVDCDGSACVSSTVAERLSETAAVETADGDRLRVERRARASPARSPGRRSDELEVRVRGRGAAGRAAVRAPPP